MKFKEGMKQSIEELVDKKTALENIFLNLKNIFLNLKKKMLN